MLYFAALAALGGHDRWGRLGVPPASVKFLDLRNVIAAWQCARRAIAVLPVNPCDPYHRPADFPKIWLVPSFLGIGQGGAVALGVGIAVVFLVCAIFVVPAGASAWTGLAYAAALCSPAVMLGVERGNPDIVIFPLVLAAVLLTTRTRAGQILTGALLLFVTVLKLYPAFAAGYLVRRATRASLTVLAVVAACSLVYVLATYHYIHEMLSSIPQSNVLTYGVRRASEWFSALAIRVVHHFGSYRAWDVLLALVGIGLGWLLSRRLRLRAPADVSGSRRGARSRSLLGRRLRLRRVVRGLPQPRLPAGLPAADRAADRALDARAASGGAGHGAGAARDAVARRVDADAGAAAVPRLVDARHLGRAGRAVAHGGGDRPVRALRRLRRPGCSRPHPQHFTRSREEEQMAFIEQVTDEEATGRAREMLETDRAATGFVQNHVRAFASRPDVYDAWVQLRGAIAGPMDKRRYELATVAAAAEIHSSYCCLVHGKILADQFVDADAVCALVDGARRDEARRARRSPSSSWRGRSLRMPRR